VKVFRRASSASTQPELFLAGSVVRMEIVNHGKSFGHVDPDGYLALYHCANDFTLHATWKLHAGPEVNTYYFQNFWNYEGTWLGGEEHQNKFSINCTKEERALFRLVPAKKQTYYIQSCQKKDRWLGTKDQYLVMRPKKHRLMFELTIHAAPSPCFTDALRDQNPAYPLAGQLIILQNQWELNYDYITCDNKQQLVAGCKVNEATVWKFYRGEKDHQYYLEDNKTNTWIGLDESEKFLQTGKPEKERICLQFHYIEWDGYFVEYIHSHSSSEENQSWIGCQDWDSVIKCGCTTSRRVPFKVHIVNEDH